ncbi:DUF3139 domain-containing protein [Terribacillus saccharophilus]|nr:DUF3139 domain-containing protein [Terribacillus saccharophilus]
MKKKKLMILLLIIVIVCAVFLGNHFINRYIAEKKIDPFIEDYGIFKDDIREENYPLFGFSPNSQPGFGKGIYTKDDGDNYYIFEYDKENDKIDVFANVYGNEVSMDDKLFKELKHQPSDKVLP